MEALDLSSRRPSDLPPSDQGVAFLHWPDEEDERRRLAALTQPRLLIVSEHASTPVIWDTLEDWVREPLDPVEVQARVELLARRHARTRPPVTIEDGVCCIEHRRVAVSELEQVVLELLVDRFGRPVPATELRDAYVAAGGTAGGFQRSVSRLRNRLEPLGLDVHTLRARALMLVRRTS